MTVDLWLNILPPMNERDGYVALQTQKSRPLKEREVPGKENGQCWEVECFISMVLKGCET